MVVSKGLEEWETELLFSEYRVLDLQWKNYGHLFHSNVNTLNTAGLFTLKWLGWWMLCVFLTTFFFFKTLRQFHLCPTHWVAGDPRTVGPTLTLFSRENFLPCFFKMISPLKQVVLFCFLKKKIQFIGIPNTHRN